LRASAFNPQDVRTAAGTKQQTPFSAASAVLSGAPSAPAAGPAPVQAPVAAAPVGAAPTPAQPSVPVPAAPTSTARSPFDPGTTQDLELKKQEAQIPLEAQKQEALKVAETAAEEQKQHYKIELTCPHCNKVGKKAGMNVWHMNNCRFKELSCQVS